MSTFISLLISAGAHFYPAIAPAAYLLYVFASGQKSLIGPALTALFVALGVTHQVASIPHKVARLNDPTNR